MSTQKVSTQNYASKALLSRAMVSPQKCRLVADLVRGLKVDDAHRTLILEKKKSAALILGVMKNAIACAEQKGTVNLDRLYISELLVNEGPRIKRVMFRAQGRADIRVTRLSHISMKLSEKVTPRKAKAKTATKVAAKKPAAKKSAAKAKTAKKSGDK